MNKEIEKQIIAYLLAYEPKQIGIFGSYARKEETANSDIDILVSFKESPTLLDLSRIRRELSEKLKIGVDLVTQRALNPKLKQYIERDLHIIFQ